MSTVLTTTPSPSATSGAVLAPPTSLPDPRSMPSEHLEAELVSHAEWEVSGTARMSAVLGEFDRREVWASWECRSAQQWLSWKCGLGYTAATEPGNIGNWVGDRLHVNDCLLALGYGAPSRVHHFSAEKTSECRQC